MKKNNYSKFQFSLNFSTLISLLILLAGSAGLAETGTGPNGGYISKPGPYNVEVKWEVVMFKVWLYDNDLENPTVDNSDVKVRVKSGEKIEPLDCTPAADHFVCPTQKSPRKGDHILVETNRKKLPGSIIEYEYPLTGAASSTKVKTETKSIDVSGDDQPVPKKVEKKKKRKTRKERAKKRKVLPKEQEEIEKPAEETPAN